jgi:pimeloyl-ACP methyl ester carboxylesterase
VATTTITLNGLDFNVLDEGHGEPVLLLHGFPDSHALWRHQVRALADAGYRVIAPDLRGFGQSAKPAATADYHLQHVLGDVLGLLDHFALPKVRLISHDWGAAVGWSLAAFAPQRVRCHVPFAVGHIEAVWNAGIAQREKSWYMLLFQFRDVAEQVLQANDWRFFRDFTRNHAECDHWIADLSRPGALTAALNWYRANAAIDNWLNEGWKLPRIQVPTCGVWSSGDAFLTEAQMVLSSNYMDAPWEYRRLEGPSHWCMLDVPEIVNGLILDYIARA